jgi:PAS domain S-box-containing protein
MDAKHEISLVNTWRTILQEVSDPICITNIKGRPLFLNTSFQRLSGHQSAESFARAGGLEASLIYGMAHEQVQEQVVRGEAWQGDVHLHLPREKKAFLHLSIKPLVHASQAVEGLLYLFKSYSISANTTDYHKLLEHFVDHANDGVMITEAEPIDIPGPRIVYVNQAITKTSGYTKEEMLGKNPRMLQGPNTDKQQLEKIRAALLAKQPIKVELINYRKNGEEYWVDFSLVPVTTKNGRVNHFVSIQRETTYKKQVEKWLQTSRQQLTQAIAASEDVFKHSLDMICSVDEHGRLVKINPACERITGYSQEELLNMHFATIVHPKDSKKTAKAFNKLLKKGIYEGFENRIIHKSGKTVQMVWNISWSEDQKLFYSIGRDITEQKETQKRLKKSEQLYKSVVENFPNGNIAIINRKWEYEFIAGKGLASINMTPADFIGKTLWNVLEPEQAKPFIEALKPCLMGQQCSADIVYKGRHYHCLTVPLPEGSEINRFLMVMQDITQMKEAEEKLQRYAHELEKANSELDQLVYKTSHDLRAPLVSVLGLISITQAEADTHIQQEYLTLMAKSIKKLDSFIKDIISFSKSARTEVAPEEIDFGTVIQEVIDELKFMEEAQAIKFQVQLDHIPNFRTDRKRLEIVLHNIIANAIRYKDPRKTTPFIRVGLTQVDLDWVLLTIEDNGIGIGQEHLDKIFNMFYRATDANVGSGLGLYIVQENIHKLKGTITVESAVEKGTSFHIQLPTLTGQE